MDKKLLDIYDLVFNFIQTYRLDTLKTLKRFEKFGVGIEGWFKVEIVRALDNSNHKIIKIRNRGADLVFANGQEIELKAAVNFDDSHYVKSLTQAPYSLLLMHTTKYSMNDMMQKMENKAIDLNIDMEYRIKELGKKWFLAALEDKN